jgi:hypothetical protein
MIKAAADRRFNIVLTSGASGEFRLRMGLCPVVKRKTLEPALSTLVYSDEVQDLTTDNVVDGASDGRLRAKTAFTRLAARRVRDASAVMEDWYGKNAIFLTGTLPGSTKIAMDEMARQASYIVARLRQWFRDTAGEVSALTVWELQKRGALHLHIVVGTNDKAKLEAIRARFHQKWCELLSQVSDRSGVDLFERDDGFTRRNRYIECRTDAQYVEKSIGRYLSKYVSKNAVGAKVCEFASPVRWWSISKDLMSEIRKRSACQIVTGVSISAALSLFEQFSGALCSLSNQAYIYQNKFDYRLKGFLGYISVGQIKSVQEWFEGKIKALNHILPADLSAYGIYQPRYNC